MLELSFARRLLPWATGAVFASVSLIVAGAVVAYGLGERTTFTLEVLGHWFIAVGAMGVKVSYLARLAAQDVLSPHPEGWRREVRPPGSLPRINLGAVAVPEERKRA